MMNQLKVVLQARHAVHMSAHKRPFHSRPYRVLLFVAQAALALVPDALQARAQLLLLDLLASLFQVAGHTNQAVMAVQTEHNTTHGEHDLHNVHTKAAAHAKREGKQAVDNIKREIHDE